jgi:POT family proton-dependent oligopeptide transporter
MASQVDEKNGNTDNGPSLPFSKIEQAFTPDSKADVHLSSQSTQDGPAASADDGRLATEDEVRDLLHVVDKVPGRVWLACIAGILERFVWYGATAPLRACNNFRCVFLS